MTLLGSFKVTLTQTHRITYWFISSNLFKNHIQIYYVVFLFVLPICKDKTKQTKKYVYLNSYHHDKALFSARGN